MAVIDWSASRSISQAQPRPIRWLVEELIPADTATLISSQSGVGKSMLALNLALCIATGKPWLGAPTQKHLIAYWDQDNPDDILTDNRLSALARGMRMSLADITGSIIFRANSLLLHKQDEVWSLGQRLQAAGITVLFVDTLASVNPWGEGEEFSRVITEGLSKLIGFGVTPIILHHIGKTFFDSNGVRHSRTGSEAARGHSSLIASVGAAYNLEINDKGERSLTCAKPRYGACPDIHIIYDEDSIMGMPDWIVTIGSTGVRLSQENLTQMIVAHGWQKLSSRNLVQTLASMGFKVSQSTAARALSESAKD